MQSVGPVAYTLTYHPTLHADLEERGCDKHRHRQPHVRVYDIVFVAESSAQGLGRLWTSTGYSHPYTTHQHTAIATVGKCKLLGTPSPRTLDTPWPRHISWKKAGHSSSQDDRRGPDCMSPRCVPMPIVSRFCSVHAYGYWNSSPEVLITHAVRSRLQTKNAAAYHPGGRLSLAWDEKRCFSRFRLDRSAPSARPRRNSVFISSCVL